MAGPVAFVLKGYPRLSETFIAQEIHGLEQRGLDIRIISLRPPRERQTHPVHRAIRAPVSYLPERLRDEPMRLLRAALRQPLRPGFRRALRAWLADLRHDPSLDRLRRFGQGLTLAYELPAEIERLHAHFLHTPASVTRYASLLSGLPWSCSAHARDIWTIGTREKVRKLKEMEWLVTCTETGRAHLAALAPRPGTVELVYHGVDAARFAPPPAPRAPHDGRSHAGAAALLSVGRAVEKKGLDVLLDALKLIPREVHWRWVHVGAGALERALQAQAERLGLGDRITWLGAQTQEEVIRRYAAADLFVLPCRIARDGDRDGLPNVLVEAQAQGLACLASHIAGIPELIQDGVNGVLVPPEDREALAGALAGLIGDPRRRRRLGAAGLAIVAERFSHARGLDRLATRFGLDAAGAAPAPALRRDRG